MPVQFSKPMFVFMDTLRSSHLVKQLVEQISLFSVLNVLFLKDRSPETVLTQIDIRPRIHSIGLFLLNRKMAWTVIIMRCNLFCGLIPGDWM